MTGAALAERFDGAAGNDTLSGDAGNDTLAGGDGNDVLFGGLGLDTATYASALTGVAVDLRLTTVQITGGAGSDRLTGIENLIGGQGNDALTGTDTANVLQAGAGNDTVLGLGGNDTLIIGTAAVYGTLDGCDGIDTLVIDGTLGSSVYLYLNQAYAALGGVQTLAHIENVTGSAGNDRLNGDEGGNVLSCGAGNDLLEGRGGDDLLMGGAGIDLVTYASATAAVQVSLAVTVGQITGAAGTDTLQGIENLTGTSFGDTLTGSGVANLLAGGSGNDALSGLGGNDTLDCDTGNDTLDGGTGSDSIVITGYANLAIDLQLTTAQDLGYFGLDTLLNIENVRITGQNHDTLTGNAADNWLDADAGNDVISGLGGNDTLVGSYGVNILDGGVGQDLVSYLGTNFGNGTFPGVNIDLAVTTAHTSYGASNDLYISIEGLQGTYAADTLAGNAQANQLLGDTGDDVLRGAAGADTLSGGTGLDQLTGGAGADVFLFDTAAAAGNLDHITDFGLGPDRLALARAVFALGTSVDAAEFHLGTAATAAQHRLIYDAATGMLSYDADGSGSGLAMQLLTLNAGQALTASQLDMV